MALKKFRKFKFTRGFTMIEILVVMGIFVVITGVTISNFPDLNNRLSLDLLAHDIALEIRKTQTYSLGFRSRPGFQDLQSYGVRFVKNSQQFVIFPDKNNNKEYDATDCNQSVAGDCIDIITIQGRSKLDTLYSGDCTSLLCEVDSLDIAFTRPNPDANLICKSGGTSSLCGTNGDAAVITVKSPKGERRKIIIRQSGQISVENI